MDNDIFQQIDDFFCREPKWWESIIVIVVTALVVAFDVFTLGCSFVLPRLR